MPLEQMVSAFGREMSESATLAKPCSDTDDEHTGKPTDDHNPLPLIARSIRFNGDLEYAKYNLLSMVQSGEVILFTIGYTPNGRFHGTRSLLIYLHPIVSV